MVALAGMGCCKPFTVAMAAEAAGLEEGVVRALLEREATEWDGKGGGEDVSVWRMEGKEGVSSYRWAHPDRLVTLASPLAMPSRSPAAPAAAAGSKRERDDAPGPRAEAAKRARRTPFRSPVMRFVSAAAASSSSSSSPASLPRPRRLGLGVRRRSPAPRPPKPEPEPEPEDEDSDDDDEQEGQQGEVRMSLEKETESLLADIAAVEAALSEAKNSTVVEYSESDTERVAALTRKWTAACQEVIAALVEVFPPDEHGKAVGVPQLLEGFGIEPAMVRFNLDDEEFF